MEIYQVAPEESQYGLCELFVIANSSTDAVKKYCEAVADKGVVWDGYTKDPETVYVQCMGSAMECVVSPVFRAHK